MGRVSSDAIVKIAPSEENKSEIDEALSRALKSAGFTVRGGDGEFKIDGGCGAIANFEGNVVVTPTRKGDAFSIEMSGNTSPSITFWILMAVGVICIMGFVGIPLLIITFILFTKAGKKPSALFDEACDRVIRQLK